MSYIIYIYIYIYIHIYIYVYYGQDQGLHTFSTSTAFEAVSGKHASD